MGKKSKKNKTGGRGVSTTTLADLSPEGYAQLNALIDQREERRRIGSSANTSRINDEAERIATEARVLKKAKQIQEAHDMYSKAIELDLFNHEYFHHRAETCWIGKVRTK